MGLARNAGLKKSSAQPTRPSGPTSTTKSAKSGLMHCNKKPQYSITSSARTRNAPGIVNPSALAVSGSHEIESGRLLDRDVGRFCPMQNSVDKLSSVSKLI
jgi:hypothetical protein